MLTHELFARRMSELCLLFDRKISTEQINIFFNSLRFRADVEIEAAYKHLVANSKRMPTISDWHDSIAQTKVESSFKGSANPPDRCPTCGGGEINFVEGDLADDNGILLAKQITFAKCSNPRCNYREPYRTYRARLYGRI